MLLELRIGNLALAEDVVLRPGPGLTVLTGETGAGKSLVAGALALLLGDRADRGLVRRGQEVAWVEAVCDLTERPDLLGELGRLGLRVAEDGLLVLRRELRREGRGRVVINGDLSSQTVLEQVGALLFAIQSQHQQQELRAAGFAREVLDAVLGLQAQRLRVAEALSSFQAAESELARRRHEHALAQEQEDVWRYQLEELTQAALQLDEEQELAEAIAIKRHARALQEAAATALASLEAGDTPARPMLGAAVAALRPHAARSQRLAAALEQVEAAASLAADAASELERFLDAFEADPRALDELEERKALYEQLQRKHRRDVAGLLALRDQLAARLARQDRAGADLEQLVQTVTNTRLELQEACQDLHVRRRDGAAQVAAAAESVIRPLALPTVDLVFAVESTPDPDGPVVIGGKSCRVAGHGADNVRLLVRTNPGEAMGAVDAIASGGEAARIHLGLTLLARRRQRPLLQLFDEIDAGLGMDAATPVAWLLRRLANGAQAVCITHLPTVAAHGDHHWLVTKQVRDGRTTVGLARLDGEARVAELARQLGGEGWRQGDHAAQLTYARELLDAAGNAAAAGA